MQKRVVKFGWWSALCYIMVCPVAVFAKDDGSQFYLDRVKPLLRTKCYVCHAATRQEGGLRLDTADAIRRGGDSGPAVDLKDVKQSLLLDRISASDPDERMPPEGKPLTEAQIAIIKLWIAKGGNAPEDEARQISPNEHWAFQPLDNVELPANTDTHPIDSFIDDRLARVGLTRSPPTDPRTLVRRLFLDLHGLPPMPKDIQGFEQSYARDPQVAVVQLVDRLLESPRYGERWAQHWLDLVRYADTHGFEVNTPRPNAWPYRDYVIHAFNDDKPYDQFVFEQIAGDSVNQDAATGFLVAAAALLPGQIGKDEASKRLARQDALDEMIVGTSATFLGLTVGCARCHDHKFDPISQRDYYAMQAFFAGVDYGDRPFDDGSKKQRAAESERLAKKIASLAERVHRDQPLAFAGRLRHPIEPGGNIERFTQVEAKFIRFSILETNNDNQYEPCIDELQVFRTGSPLKNIALATEGTRATSSGNLAESGKHQLKHINDGKHGNSFSWISDEIGRGWVQLEFPSIETIDCVEWARDRHGKFKDRLPVVYKIEISLDGSHWKTVAGSMDRMPPGTHVDEFVSSINNSPKRIALQATVAELNKLRQRKRQLDQPKLVFAGKFRTPDVTKLLLRGDPEQPIEDVAPNVPGIFKNTWVSGKNGPRRVELAKWIANPKNPLTARVISNRIWQYHFGRGLVDTSSDFGLSGARTAHSALLDWLAMELINHDWSLNHLHRTILSSATYQQSSAINARAQAIDADTRLFWRFPSRRLEGEAIRDSMLWVSGQLNLKMGGPGFDFFETRGGLSGFPPVEQFGAEGLRRMIYAHKIRMEQVPVFGSFDCPDAGQPTPKRSRSTTAIQALNLFNSPFVSEQATRFSELVSEQAGDSIPAQIEFAFLRALGRKPTDREQSATLAVARQHGLKVVCRVLFNSNEFIFLP